MVAFHARGARHFVNFFLTNAVGMHIGFVRQVHQVIHHQLVIALDVIKTTAIGPRRVVKKFKLG